MTATAVQAPAGIRARNVRVAYGEVVALDGVDLDLAPGRVYALVGVNGSGKSSLFKALMGTVRLTSGAVELGGLSGADARARGLVSYMPQSENVDWTFPVRVREVVMMGRYGLMGRFRRIRPVDAAAVDDALARVELSELGDRQIGRLSGGQRKRAFLARAIAQGARILLLDEPFAGVDKPSEATITALLRDLAAGGHTVVVSTHDLAGVPALADSVVLLQQRVVAEGTPDDVLRPEVLSRAFGSAI